MSGDTREIVVGGLCATKDEDGTYRVTKVLVVDDFAVHIRIYANRFDELPTDVDPSVLNLGGINSDGGFGIGHAPMAKEGFFNDHPQFIKQVPVADEELEGYRLYLEAMGGSE